MMCVGGNYGDDVCGGVGDNGDDVCGGVGDNGDVCGSNCY